MDLHEALAQISEIRQHVAQTQTFRGYRAAPVAFSGVVACIAATVQHAVITDPAGNLAAYFALWIGSALLSMLVTGLAMYWYCLRSTSPLTRTNTMLAVGQFLPSVSAGGLVTFVLYKHVNDALWMLPGLWSIFFSLGIFASLRVLPRSTLWVGVFYMTAGIVCLLLARDAFAFSPWAMAVPFGLGQFLSAAILYWTLERNHDEYEETHA